MKKGRFFKRPFFNLKLKIMENKKSII